MTVHYANRKHGYVLSYSSHAKDVH